MELTEFLLARIAEDEEWAKHRNVVTFGLDDSRMNPGRVLAECEAKRRIVEGHAGRHVCQDNLAGKRWDEDAQDLVDDPCWNLRTLGAVYADHPDFDPVWRP